MCYNISLNSMAVMKMYATDTELAGNIAVYNFS